MAKVDHPALLIPGLHALLLPDLHSLAVAPFNFSSRRQDLFDRFSAWIEVVRASGVTGRLWVDGSYLTQKVEPNDIDCVLWNPNWLSPESDTPQNRERLEYLFDREVALTLYGLDLYVAVHHQEELFHREAYWRSVFGYAHDGVTAKGFAELHL